MKLNLGCGPRLFHLPGWVNIDKNPDCGPNLLMDLTKNLPYENNSVDFIVTEHFLEHITRIQADFLMSECYRVLKVGGVIRINVPDLETLVNKYITNDVRGWETTCPNRCHLMNFIMNDIEHRFIYDFDELYILLNKAGFSSIERCEINRSKYTELCDVNCRKEGDLISIVVEGVK